MARPYVRSIQPRDAKEIFGKLSQTNHYQVSFGSLPGEVERHIRRKFGVFDANNFMSRKGGVLCSDASLPGSSLATGEVRDNFMGIPQEFAHTRLYADVDFTFYVDLDYTNLRIFEGWIDYISSGSESTDGMNELTDNYYRRMQYPENYKANTMYITKFEKDIDNNGRRLDYLFVNAFPKLVNAIPVQYGGADILKVGVSFNYDRYIMNPRGSVIRGNPGSFTDIDRTQPSAELNQTQENIDVSTAAAAGAEPLYNPFTEFNPTTNPTTNPVINNDPFSPNGNGQTSTRDTAAQNQDFVDKWREQYNSDGTKKPGPGATRVREVFEGW